MSRFFSNKYDSLEPYVPGEQPKEIKYIKLNTNESPFPPSTRAISLAAEAAKNLQLYSDPECRYLIKAFQQIYGLEADEVLFTNGSDEILNFAFMSFCDADHPAAFADLTYGFYPVFAQLNRIPYTEIPLKDDFTIDITEYFDLHKTIFIANPNAPTGIILSVHQIEQILNHNRDSVVVIDEAYIDFGGESCIPLIHKYDNLLVCQTFSKSRSLAGARLGFGVANRNLIQDLNTIKYSTNPYNINRCTSAAGIGALLDDEYMKKNCQTIIENREYTAGKLKELGFEMTDSMTNFLFVKNDQIDGEKLYLKLKEKGILIRHFSKDRIKEYNRITIGTREQMDILLTAIAEIMEDK